MFRNQLHPITIFSSFVLAISLLSLGIALQLLEDRWSRYSYEIDGTSALWTNWSWQDLLGVLLFLGIGAFLMTAALGLMFYKKWARYLMQLGFVIAGLAWLAFLSYNLSELRNAPLVFGGMTAAVLGNVVGSLLFLNNTEWVLPYFQAHDERDGDVLDRDIARSDEEGI